MANFFHVARAVILAALLIGGIGAAAEDLPQGANTVLSQVPPAQSQPVQAAPDSASGGAVIDYAEWAKTAGRAEAVLEDGRASDQALEALRLQVVEWRQRFLSAQNANKSRIETLQNQLSVLGPPPEEGGENAEIAARRADLNAQLGRLVAPIKTAEEAYLRANGITSEIDAVIRERQADALVSLGPSPLNLALWPQAVTELTDVFNTLRLEFLRNFGNEVRQYEFRDQLLVIVPLAIFGLVLLLRGRRWMGRMALALQRMRHRGGEFWSFLMSLGKVFVPILGLLALTGAILQTGFVGIKLELLLAAIPVWGASLLAARWLLDRLFPDGNLHSPFMVPVERRADGRRLGTLLACMVILGDIANYTGETMRLSAPTQVVMNFPVLLLTALVLLRSARFVLGLIRAGLSPDQSVPFRLSIVRLLAQAASVVALIGPVLAAVGYSNAAHALVYSTVLTCALLGFIFVLQTFIDDAYALVAHKDGQEVDALLPTLIGFCLVLLSLPILALIWGARVAELTELWSRFLEGVSIGGSQISPVVFLTLVVLFAVGYISTRLLQGALRSSILPKTKIDPGGQTAIVSGVGYVGIFLAALVAITGAGLDLSSIAIVAGALSVGIGFGLQNIVSNFVSGIILLIERPIAEGDWIEVGGQMGYVRDISVRSTRIETFDRTDVIVPNADLVSGTVTNYTRGNTVGRVIIRVGVAYGSDTRQVEAVLLAIAEAHPMVLANPAPSIVFQGFGADSMDFEIRAILRDVNWTNSVKSEINHEIVRRFREEGIEIPFAQREVRILNPEAFQPKPARKPDGEPI